jgi:glutamate-1-semialdehyde 2,1-aminomutase
MQMVSPEGPVYQAGTLSGNPLAMAAGLETLTMLRSDPGFYDRLERKANRLAGGIVEAIRSTGIAAVYQHVGSMGTLFFTRELVSDYATALKSDKAAFGRYFTGMLNEGIYLPPSQFEAAFLSDAHSDEDIEKTIRVHRKVLETMSS